MSAPSSQGHGRHFTSTVVHVSPGRSVADLCSGPAKAVLLSFPHRQPSLDTLVSPDASEKPVLANIFGVLPGFHLT